MSRRIAVTVGISAIFALAVMHLLLRGGGVEEAALLPLEDSSAEVDVEAMDTAAGPPGRPHASPHVMLGESAAVPPPASSAEVEDEEAAPRFSGRVFLPGGEPAPEATVEAFPSAMGEAAMVAGLEEPPLASTITGLDGRFHLALSRAGDMAVTVQASKEGYASAAVTVFGPGMTPAMPEDMAQTSGLELQLSEEAAAAGTLLYTDGRPAAGYEMHYTRMHRGPHMLEAVHSPGKGAVTDAGGGFRLRGLVRGEAVIIALRDGQFIHEWEVRLPDEALELTIPEGGITLSGRVYRKDSGFAVADADIVLVRHTGGPWMGYVMARRLPRGEGLRYETVSGTGGNYTFENLRPGIYAVQARHREERLGLHRVEMSGDPVPHHYTHAVVSAIRVPEEVEHVAAAIYLYEGDQLRGRVQEGESGDTIPGVEVTVSAGHPGTRDLFGDPASVYTNATDSLGRFSIPHVLHPGDIIVQARKEGYVLYAAQAVEERSYAPAGGPAGARMAGLSLARKEDTVRNILLKMSRQFSISGLVRYEDGTPVVDAQVAFAGERTQDRWYYPLRDAEWQPVDHQGRFTIPVEAGATGAVVVRTEAARNLSSGLLTVKDRPLEGVEIVVGNLGRISGRVVDTQGRAVPRAGVTLDPRLRTGTTRYESAGEVRTTTGADGRFRFETLAAGQYRLTARLAGRVRSDPEQLDLGPGESRTGVMLTLQAGHEIRIRVVDSHGNAVKGAQVGVSRVSGSRWSAPWGQTDGEGRYSYSSAPEGPLLLIVDATGHERKVVRDFQPGPEEQQISLEPLPRLSAVVHVVDGETGRPVSGFSARAYDYPPYRELETEPGRFVDRDLRPNTPVPYRVTHPGYAAGELRLYAEQDAGVMERTIRLYKGSEITGRIVYRGTAQPPEDTRVEYYAGNPLTAGLGGATATVRAGPDGRFRFDRVTAGPGVIQVISPSPYVPRSLQVTPDGRTPLDVGDIEVGDGGAVRVTVLRNGNPVAGQGVIIAGLVMNIEYLHRAGVTGEDGSYTFENLPHARYAVVAGERSLEIAGVRDGELKEVTVALGSATLELEARHRGESATVLASYRLSLWSAAHGSRAEYSGTDAGQGVHRYENLGAGIYTVDVQRYSQSSPFWLTLPGIASYTLSEGEERREVLNLPGGEIHGRIVDAGGEPVRGASLVHRALDEDNRQGHLYKDASAAGEIAANLLSPGRHWLRAEHPELGSAEKTVELGRDELIEDLRLVLGEEPAGTLVSIALRMTDGQPVENAWCRVRAEDGRDYTPSGNQQRDADGALTIENLPAGEYNVEVSAWGHSEGHHTVIIEAGQTTYIDDILYEAGSMRWTLVSEDGAPIARAETRLVPLDPDSIETVRTGRTSDAGQWSQRGLYPGQYRAEATLPDGLTLTQPFTITAHEHTEETTTR